MCLFLYFFVKGNRNLPDKQAFQAQEVVQGEQAHFFYLKIYRTYLGIFIYL
jgi:hypothetical protein